MSQVLQQNIVELAPLVSDRTSTLTGSAVDLAGYDGPAHIILQCEAAGAGTNPTMNVKIQHATASGGTYNDVSGLAFAEVTETDSTQMISCQVSDLRQFIRVVGTLGGTSSPSFTFGVSMVALKKDGRNASQSV